jgi:hypothetical protein
MERGLQAVRSWYGLRGEIDVEHQLYHLVKVGPIPLPHPPLVNLLLRRGLPRDLRLKLSFLHELGHLQTLPIVVIHLLALLRLEKRRRRKGRSTPKSILGLLLAHEAVWELASEVYALFKSGKEYLDAYKRYPNKLGHLLFWGGMITTGSLFTMMLDRKENSQRK